MNLTGTLKRIIAKWPTAVASQTRLQRKYLKNFLPFF
jgi:hypothetical protein